MNNATVISFLKNNFKNFILNHTPKGAVKFFTFFFYSALLFINCQCTNAQFYNGYEMTFGKNRVQYEERNWSFYKWKSYDTYFYLGGQDLAIFTGRMAGTDLEEIEKLFDYKLDGRIQFVIYNKLSDAKQSNIGLETDENSGNIGGVTRIVGNKVFLYFTGDHEKLHRQIRAGIAKVLIDEIMYGGDIKDRIQNSALLTLPDWYLSGLISYIAHHWDADLDNRVRDGIITKKYLKFNHLTGTDALYAGHSVWKYIADTYGENSIANLLYMTRINRNVESGFLYVLGLTTKNLAANWKDAMIKIYAGSDGGRDSIPTKSLLRRPKSFLVYNQVKVSPDGGKVVFVTNDIGKYKVFLYDISKNKKKRVKRGGYRSYIQDTDETFPLIAWHPSGQLFSMMRERKGKIFLAYYTLDTKKIEEVQFFNFEKVLDFSYSPDGQYLLLSAIQKGQSDVFVFNLRTRTYEQLTKDFYDDLHPRFINNGNAIVFSSNRVNDTLDADHKTLLPPQTNFDIFYYDYKSRSKILRRITETANNETQPVPYNESNFAFLSDANGIVNRYTAHLDSTLSSVDTAEHYSMIVTTYPQTNYSRNIISHDVNSSLNRISDVLYYNGRLRMYVEPLAKLNTSQGIIPNTIYRNETNKDLPTSPLAPKNNIDGQQKPVVTDSNAVNIDDYVFQSDFPKSKSKKEKKKTEKGFVTVNTDGTTAAPLPSELTSELVTASESHLTDSISIPKQRPYETAFSSNYFVSQLDNTLMNNSYQLFSGGGGLFFNPGLNGFFQLGISDLLNDYKITGGIKIAGDFNSNEYFISYENLKNRLDKQITFYRQARFELSTQTFTKIHTHELRYYNKYPFSDVASIRGSIAYRNDREVFLAVDVANLVRENLYNNWATSRLEFVFDNSVSKGLNLYNGTRAKFWAEYYKLIEDKSDMYVLGIDYRYYMKVHREIIWANRFAASTSFGKNKLIYYLGATDNWLSPEFNTETPIDYSQNYAYQATATNLRGFEQNIRNGNSFALINSELRIPIFKYLFNRPIRSDFIRNFQIVGFGDIGTAWTGASPYDSSNALNNKVIYGNPFVVTLVTQHDPIVGGYGFGLRTRILGYFLRGDWAWGIQDGEVQPYRFYVSLSLDF